MTVSAGDVAVVIPSRDRPDMLRSCLKVIRAATPPEVEIIVVDSASATRETYEVVRESAVRYVRCEMAGVSIARNAGVAATRRPIVVFTDDDAHVTPGWIDTLRVHFAAPEVAAVTGRLLDHSRIGQAGQSVERAPVVRITQPRRGLDAGHGALMAFRRTLIAGREGFDEVLGAGRRLAGAEDTDMFCRLLSSGSTIVCEPNAVVHHMHTRSDGDYAVLRRGYGLGTGAMVNKWLRFEPLVGLQLLVTVLWRSVPRLIRSRADPRRRSGEAAALAGFVRGLLSSARLRLDGRRFVDIDRL